MENSRVIAIFGIIFLLICMIGAFFAPMLHNYEVNKCKTIGVNDYVESDCYNPIHAPDLNLFLAFMVVTCFPGIILFVVFMIWFLEEFY